MSERKSNDEVVIVEYDPRWPAAYRSEAALISQALAYSYVEMHHVGSTAVPGLSAKPTIDILVAVAQFARVQEYVRRLAPIGYQHVSHEEDAVRLFFRKGVAHSHHLHIVEYDGWEYRRHLLFRDHLRTHPETAQEYERLKQRLADQFSEARATYTASKANFVRSVIAAAAREHSIDLSEDTGRPALEEPE